MLGIIVTKTKYNGIVKESKMPWEIKEAQKEFMDLSINNTVIMDLAGFEDRFSPYPDRLNLVISTRTRFNGRNIITVKNLDQALYLATDNAYILGGAELFKKTLPLVDEIYITEANAVFPDEKRETFPEIDLEQFDMSVVEETESYKKFILTRKKEQKLTK